MTQQGNGNGTPFTSVRCDEKFSNDGRKRSMRAPRSVWLVQSAASPYWDDRIKSLSELPDFELTILVEHADMTSFTGFPKHTFAASRVKGLRSLKINKRHRSNENGFTSNSFWSVPFLLTTFVLLKKPDVILVCNALQTLFSWIGAVFTGSKIILMVEDTPHSVAKLSSFRQGIKARIYRLADSWTYYSKDSESYLNSICMTKKKYYVPWSIELQKKCSIVINKNVEEKLKVVFVGQLIERKGVDLLLRAWSQIPISLRSKSQLHLIGDGPLRGGIESEIRQGCVSEVAIEGRIPNLAVREHLESADLFVFPTLEDVYGIALLEAVAHGCPVITTPYAGGRELVTEENGWIIDPLDVTAFTAALTDALGDPLKLRQMRLASLSVGKNYNTVSAIDKLRSAILHTFCY
jgi:glycosyltransferase involved in cell wall biosynthesis